MTVTTTHSYVKSVANGTNKVFGFDFVLLDDGDLEVYNGVDLVNPSLYSVAIASDNYGGTITFITAPPQGSVITSQRVMPQDQQTSYPEGGPFPPKAHERALDKLTMLVQQQQHAVDSAVEFYRGNSMRKADDDSPWDARGFRMISMADPIAPSDGATKGYVDGLIFLNQEYAEQAVASSVSSASSAAQSLVSSSQAIAAQQAVVAASAGFTGFPAGNNYDFGSITDSVTYFNQNFGSV